MIAEMDEAFAKKDSFYRNINKHKNSISNNKSQVDLEHYVATQHEIIVNILLRINE